MSERDRRLDALLARALDATSEERAVILAEAGALRGELEEMLGLHAGAPRDFLETPARERLRRTTRDVGERVGRFTIRGALAAGGSGTVYEAEQDLPRRVVALKLMRAGVLSDRAQARFLGEAETLARLEHPGIAHVYEAGLHEGQPYIAMELVPDAATLTEHATGLDLPARLTLLAEACDAVHFGHVRGVVHGDVKPANLLVRDGHVKVVDYGIAEAEGAARDIVAGTPAYMSPEQRDATQPLDARSDVYALGVVLGELLGPAAPSDVRAVVARATAPRQRDRYASAAALADDLRRFMAHEPVTARRAGWWHHVALFARRRTAVAVLLASLGLALIAGITVSTGLAVDAERARADAERQAYLGTISAAAGALRLHDVREARTQLARAPKSLRGWEWRHLVAQVRDPSAVLEGSGTALHGAAVAGSAPVTADTSSSKRNVRVRDIDSGRVLLDVPRKGLLRYCCALAPDGDVLYTGRDDGAVDARRVPSGELLWEARRATARVWRLAVSRDGARICATCVDGTVFVYDADGFIQRQLRHDGGAYGLAFSSDGKRLFTGGSTERDVRAWDLATGAQLWRATGHDDNVEALSVSSDDALVASGSMDGTIRVWGANDGARQLVLRGHARGVKDVAFHPTKPWLASGSVDTTVRVWDAHGGSLVLRLLGHEWQVRSVGWLADGRRLVSHGREGRIHVWDVERRAVTPELPGLEPQVAHLRFRTNHDLALASHGGRVAHADVTSLRVIAGPDTGAEIGCLAERGHLRVARSGAVEHVSEDGTVRVLGTVDAARVRAIAPLDGSAVLGDHDGRVRVVGAAGALTWQAHEEPIVRVASHGGLLVTTARSGAVRIWRGKARVAEFLSTRRGTALASDEDGRRLFVGRSDGSIEVRSLPGGQRLARFTGHTGPIDGLALSPDGSRLASASQDGTVRLWHVAWGVSLLTLQGHSIYATSVAWSPDGTRLASGGGAGLASACTVRIWEAPAAR